MPPDHKLSKSVDDLHNTAVWQLDDFKLGIGTHFHTEQGNPALVDSVAVKIESSKLHGRLLGYLITRCDD